MPENMPAQGKGKATSRDVQRETIGRGQDWLFPRTSEHEVADAPGKLICPTCHAISLQKRWFLDEVAYERLRKEPDVKAVQCAGCLRVERGNFDGSVIISGKWLSEHKSEILSLIKNTESRARQTNPFSRVGATHDMGSEVELYVTTQWLAERIGKELHKAYKGELAIDHLAGEKFSRVRWSRD